ncbi:MAG: hypothetical protein RSB38_09635, partial [Oscillospiraceae bacterium]
MKKLEKQEIIKLEMQCILVIKKLCWGNSKGEIIDVSCDNGQWKIMNLNDFSIQQFENRAVAEKY